MCETREVRNPVRVYCDGCFDLVHYGHANSLRQAKSMGDVLVVGIHGDKEITEAKGPPVYTAEERLRIVSAMKWVDEVVEGVTYFPTVENTLERYNCDFCAHGDDICHSADGVDVYRKLREAGRLKLFNRTEGISTTDIVGRMLLMSRTHHHHVESISQDVAQQFASGSNRTKISGYLESRKIAQFSDCSEPKVGSRVVYVSGSWDLLHAGYIDFLEAARREGDYLIVGIHPDQEVNANKGANFPITNLYERALGVLSLKAVSEVVIGAPYAITDNLMNELKIDVVVHGWTSFYPQPDRTDPMKEIMEYNEDHTPKVVMLKEMFFMK